MDFASLPSPARLARYACLLLLASCGPCDEAAHTLGPVPVGVTVDRLVTSAQPGIGGYLIEIDFRETASFTVTAVDEEGRPVANSQNGIRVDVHEDLEILDVEVSDEPDPDNATIRVIVTPLVASAMADLGSGSRVDLRFVNPDGSEAAAGVLVGIHHPVDRLELQPPGPITVAVDHSLPVTLRALDAQGQPVAGVERFLDVTSTNTLGDSDFDLDVDWNGPEDGILNGVVTGRHPDQGSATFSLAGAPEVAAVTLAVHVVETLAPTGHVVSVTSRDAIHVNVEWDFEALIYDGQGQPVPGDEWVSATSSDPSVASILDKIDDVAGDGRVKFRVKGLSAGQSTITYHYPGGPDGADTTDTTILTVNP